MVAIAVLALSALLAWSVFDNASRPGAAAQAPASSAASASPSAPPDAAGPRPVESASASSAADTATIVDTDNPFGGKSVAATAGPNPFGETAAAQRPVKRANPFASAQVPAKRPESARKPGVAATEPKAAAQRSAPPKAAPATPVEAKNKGDETALGNSLLGNIVTAEAPPLNPVRAAPVSLASPAVQALASPAAAEGGLIVARPETKLVRPLTGSDHEALDALIQQVDPQQRVKPMAADEPLARAEKLQRDLRRCPKANTTAGIDCRIKACRDYGEKDAACAVKH